MNLETDGSLGSGILLSFSLPVCQAGKNLVIKIYE